MNDRSERRDDEWSRFGGGNWNDRSGESWRGGRQDAGQGGDFRGGSGQGRDFESGRSSRGGARSGSFDRGDYDDMANGRNRQSGQYGGGRYTGQFGGDPYGGSPYGGQFSGGRSSESGGYSAESRGDGRFGNRGGSGWSSQSGFESSRRGRGFAGKGPKGYTRADDRIREEVSDALMADDDLDASEVTVNVSGGEVTLSGTVDSREAKRMAEELAERVQGVQNVQNSLRVQANGSPQEDRGSSSRRGQYEAGQAGRDAGNKEEQNRNTASARR
jgi:osmotically-inducible protein OsmY